jgi:ribose 5-phosphate isomerase B
MVWRAFLFQVNPGMSSEAIAIASDHGGYELKTSLIKEIEAKGLKVIDLGTDSLESVDYPDFADAMAQTIRGGKASRGVLLCGSGIGISIAANRHPELRAALVHDGLTARLSRQHNDANILVMGGRLIGPELAKDCLDIFLKTEFEGGRHARRVAKMSHCA